MRFTKAIAVLALALTATALPTVEDLVARQGTTGGGGSTGVNGESCGNHAGALACCASKQKTTSNSLIPYLSGLPSLLPIILQILLTANTQTALTCSPILSSSITNCRQTQTCCFTGPSSQTNGNSLISLFNNNQLVFCPDFELPANIPITVV